MGATELRDGSVGEVDPKVLVTAECIEGCGQRHGPGHVPILRGVGQATNGYRRRVLDLQGRQQASMLCDADRGGLSRNERNRIRTGEARLRFRARMVQRKRAEHQKQHQPCCSHGPITPLSPFKSSFSCPIKTRLEWAHRDGGLPLRNG